MLNGIGKFKKYLVKWNWLKRSRTKNNWQNGIGLNGHLLKTIGTIALAKQPLSQSYFAKQQWTK